MEKFESKKPLSEIFEGTKIEKRDTVGELKESFFC